jgi:3-oxoacyl-(acyl-carrier-protein) synthase III
LAPGNCPAFDLSAACAGFLYGLSIADQFIRTGQLKRVLVIGVELLSRILNWEDRTTCVLFGDGAGAVVLGPAEPAKEGEAPRGVMSTRIYTDGSLAGALFIPGGGSALPMTHEAVDERKNKVHIVGHEVFKVAVKNLSSASKAGHRRGRATGADIDWVFFLALPLEETSQTRYSSELERLSPLFAMASRISIPVSGICSAQSIRSPRAGATRMSNAAARARPKAAG